MFRVREMSPSRKFDKVAHSKTFHEALGENNEPLTAKTKVEIETVLRSALGRDCH
jgi:hypothetical protein